MTERYYNYVKFQDGLIDVLGLVEINQLKRRGIIEVLAPCDYEELQRLKEENRTLTQRIERLEKALKFYAEQEHAKIENRTKMREKKYWVRLGEADNYWNNGEKNYCWVEDGEIARQALDQKGGAE